MTGGVTARLRIEPLAHGHAAGLIDALGHESVARFLPAPDVTTVDALHERIDRLALGSGRPDEIWLNFAVLRADDGAVIGRLEATIFGEWAEIAYLVGPRYERRGYGREATRWLVECLTARGVGEVWACIHPDNARSIALVEDLGFVRQREPVRALGSFDAGDAVFMR
jgi:RimJ/RimL family protein N-acetyltransferase